MRSSIFKVNIVAHVAGKYRCLYGFSCLPVWLVFLGGIELFKGTLLLWKCLPCIEHWLAVVRSPGLNLEVCKQ